MRDLRAPPASVTDDVHSKCGQEWARAGDGSCEKRRMRALAIISILTATAHANPPKSSLSAADQKKYKDLLRKGRDLEAKKDYPHAIAAFEDCLKVAADDATALSELGFTLYETKDYKRAETITRKALANQAAPNVRGAALFNLGLIREAQKDNAGAIAAYGDSLRARPNAVVRSRLKKLDPKVAAMFEPYAPVALAGPFASIAAYCKTAPKTESVDGDSDVEADCTCGTKVDGPAGKLEVFIRTCQIMSYGTTYYQLAMKTPKGVYIGALRSYDFNRHCDEAFKFVDAKVDGDRVVATYSAEGSCTGGTNEDDWTERGIAVIGGSATPAMTPTLLVKKKETHQDDAFEDNAPAPKTIVDVDLSLTWSKDGVEVKGKTTGLDKTEAANLLGKHTLVFP
jgi:tetratricopeptide (TPR) repeat protein